MSTKKQQITRERNWGSFRLKGAIGAVNSLLNLSRFVSNKQIFKAEINLAILCLKRAWRIYKNG